MAAITITPELSSNPSISVRRELMVFADSAQKIHLFIQFNDPDYLKISGITA